MNGPKLLPREPRRQDGMVHRTGRVVLTKYKAPGRLVMIASRTLFRIPQQSMLHVPRRLCCRCCSSGSLGASAVSGLACGTIPSDRVIGCQHLVLRALVSADGTEDTLEVPSCSSRSNFMLGGSPMCLLAFQLMFPTTRFCTP